MKVDFNYSITLTRKYTNKSEEGMIDIFEINIPALNEAKILLAEHMGKLETPAAHE